MIDKVSFTELNKKADRKYVLFGSGNIANKTLRKVGFDSVDFIVDNSENLQGQEYAGLSIKTPAEIKPNHFVLICSTAINSISQQLTSLGFTANSDYTISPILNDLLAISELENLKTTFHFCSGTMPIPGEKYGGGLYKCEVDGLDHKLTKLYEGPTYGAIKRDGNIYFVDTDKGILRLDDSGNIDLVCELAKGSRAHGISYNETTKCYYVTCSYLDAILEISEDWEIKRTFKLSNKIDQGGEPMHHCNDNLAVGNSLYVSMFSSTGNWKNDSFDGCIAEFDIVTGERRPDVCTGLYMPHNVEMFDGSLHILDSLPGHLRFINFSVQGTFPAFTRGLDYNKGLYYIGQSKNRNYSRVQGISNNIAIDCGVVVFNPEIKASRFFQFPYTIGEIHTIVC